MNGFYLSTLNSADNATPRMVEVELAENNIELFAARFINGLVQQAHAQTGHSRPIGETTAIRIASELFAFSQAVGGIKREFDYSKVKENLRLDIAV